MIKSTTLLRNGMYSYTITLILFPKTEMISESMIASRNSTVYTVARILR